MWAIYSQQFPEQVKKPWSQVSTLRPPDKRALVVVAMRDHCSILTAHRIFTQLRQLASRARSTPGETLSRYASPLLGHELRCYRRTAVGPSTKSPDPVRCYFNFPYTGHIRLDQILIFTVYMFRIRHIPDLYDLHGLHNAHRVGAVRRGSCARVCRVRSV